MFLYQKWLVEQGEFKVLDSDSKIIFLMLMEFAGTKPNLAKNLGTAECFPGYELLEGLTGYSHRRIADALKILENSKLISIRHRNKKSNVYRILNLIAPGNQNIMSDEDLKVYRNALKALNVVQAPLCSAASNIQILKSHLLKALLIYLQDSSFSFHDDMPSSYQELFHLLQCEMDRYDKLDEKVDWNDILSDYIELMATWIEKTEEEWKEYLKQNPDKETKLKYVTSYVPISMRDLICDILQSDSIKA